MSTRAQIKRATTLAQKATSSLDAEAAQSLIDLYKAEAADIAARIRAHAGPDDNIALQELRSLLDQVEAIMRRLSAERDALLADALAKAADYGARPVLGNVTPAGAMVSSPASQQVAEEALRFVRSFVAEDGLQLSDRIWRLDRGARDAVVNAIERAVIQGHGAAQAAREFLSRGERVPIDLLDKAQQAGSGRIAKEVRDQLLTGTGSPMDNSLRLMRTEINRAHGEAYMMSGEDHPDFGGWRYLLSPAHPKPDICDLLSTQNTHGLRAGVYPNRERCPWPAHPNTLSFIEIVFRDEITDADRAGKETPLQALARLDPAQRIGVLGKNKHDVFKEGRLTQGMIRAPWRAVQKRIGISPVPKAATKPHSKPVASLDDILQRGAEIGNGLLQRAAALGDVAERLPEVLLADLNKLRPTQKEAALRSQGDGARLVRAASRVFPDAWTVAADKFGPLYARSSDSRGWQLSLADTVAGQKIRFKGFSFVAEGNDGLIVAGRFSTAVHEYAHRLQHALPKLDDLFQELHHRRTDGDPLRRLRDLLPGYGYATHEVTREDKYTHPYQGRIYARSNYLGKHGALEVMTMAFESVLGGQSGRLEKMLKDDREMFNLVIGALYHYVP